MAFKCVTDEETDEQFCQRCNDFLWSQTEKDFRMCNRCLDRMAEREQERREWDHYHPQ